jgi:hypothetical protein
MVNVAEVGLSYSGSKYQNAGTCQAANEVADDTFKEIIEKIPEQSLVPDGL